MAIDKIGSAAITDCTVVAADIAPGTVTNAKLAGSIANAKLANSSVTINGTSISLGASGSIPAVSWQSVVVSDGSTVTTMVAGRGYFVDNTSAAGIVKLPASASAGDTIAIKDYAGNFGTNNLAIQRNSHKIQGVANDGNIATNRASLTLVYVDATKGWLYANESNVGNLENKGFIEATGGTVTTSGDYKIHSFTGDGCFVVSQLGFGGTPCNQATKVSYIVVAGGGGSVTDRGGAGGAGGFREGKCSTDPYTDSPLDAGSGLTVTASTFPITVGAGGAGDNSPPYEVGASGSNSVFSTITSAGGGGGGRHPNGGANGGSGGGGGPTGGTGNTPPVSPSQGSNGGSVSPSGPPIGNSGGGGATAVGGNGAPGAGGDGGAGATTHITGSPVAYAGGGGGGHDGGSKGCGGAGGGGDGASGPYPGSSVAATDGTANTGGGAGGSNGGGPSVTAKAGGKGIVIIRYKFQ